MKAVRLEAVGQLFLRDIERPEPGPGDLLVRVDACGICGTDRHLFRGTFPSRPPVTIGHELCGTVVDLAPDVTGFEVGVLVTCDPNVACRQCAQCQDGRSNLCAHMRTIGIHSDGGLAEFVLVPAAQACALPSSLDPAHGAFCEPLACCLHAVDLAAIRPGASVVVLGGGVIGLLTVQLARLAGAANVVLVTRQPSKRELALEIGATAAIDPNAGSVVDRIAGPEGLLPGGAEVVIECAGAPETMSQMTRLARSGGTVVVLGVMPKGQTIPFEPQELLVRELKIFGSFINPSTLRRASQLIANRAIELDRLISRKVPLDAVPQIVREPVGEGTIKTMFVR
ncbi:MAG: zinc-dependent alcohol dehydrogenase family protein [Rhizobiaceae bacterium]|nr:zinc-dependent alcohol dehydrogenase family protein [Rhizobiaceae bacterium]